MSMVPVVASVAELPDAIKYAEDRPNSRWFVSRRAIALGAADQIPESWGEAITAASSAADLNTAQRDALAAKGVALKDGSFPIRNRTDLSKAVRALGRAKNRAAAKRHILKRARALHSTDLLPDSYKPLTSATVSNDEAGLWVAQVRDLITESGNDPDVFEAGTDGFEADYEQYADDPQGYVDELIAANADPDEESDDKPDEDEDTVSEPETAPTAPAAPAQVVPTMPVAAAATTTSTGTAGMVQIFTAQPAPAPQTVAVDMDALVAAIKAASREAVDEALVAAKKPPVDDTTGDPLSPEDAALVPDDVPAPPADAAPAPDAPVNLDAAKEKLRGKFGPKPAKKAKPAPPVAASALTSAASMRERMAARTAG